ncbi:MAG: hypothetical protein KKG59_01725 [Nanoarchaeota archaeon]|nr:hypothetical protein [Nanoarchaeota archaeon]
MKNAGMKQVPFRMIIIIISGLLLIGLMHQVMVACTKSDLADVSKCRTYWCRQKDAKELSSGFAGLPFEAEALCDFKMKSLPYIEEDRADAVPRNIARLIYTAWKATCDGPYNKGPDIFLGEKCFKVITFKIPEDKYLEYYDDNKNDLVDPDEKVSAADVNLAAELLIVPAGKSESSTRLSWSVVDYIQEFDVSGKILLIPEKKGDDVTKNLDKRFFEPETVYSVIVIKDVSIFNLITGVDTPGVLVIDSNYWKEFC